MDIDGRHLCDECIRRFGDNEADTINAAVCYVPAEGDDLQVIYVCDEHYLSTYGDKYPRVNIPLRA